MCACIIQIYDINKKKTATAIKSKQIGKLVDANDNMERRKKKKKSYDNQISYRH